MSKIKGLLSSIKGNQESPVIILPYNKQIEGYQKVIKKIYQAYKKSFVQPYNIFCYQISQLNKTVINQLKSCVNKPQFYLNVVQIFGQIQKSYRNTNAQINDYSEQGFNVIQNQCQKLKNNLNILYQKLKQHETKQFQLNQYVKKYTINHRNICQAIDLYKNSFQDVKLIYNIQQKIKRFKNCQTLYNNILEALKQINQNIQSLSIVRDELKIILQNFTQKSIQFARSVWLQIIKIPYNIMKCFINGNKSLEKIIIQKLRLLQQKDIKIIFQKFRLPYPYPQHFDKQTQQIQNNYFPKSIANLKSLRNQSFGNAKVILLQYYKSTRDDITQRQNIIEKIKTYFMNLSNNLERMFITQSRQVKQMLNQKMIKLILDGFSIKSSSSIQQKESVMMIQKLHPIQKSIFSVIQFLEEQKNLFRNMSKLYSQSIKQIVQELDDESKQLTLFKDQIKNKFCLLFQGKKQFKKDLEMLKSGQILSLSLTQKQIKEMKDQIIKKSESIVVMISGFAQKFKNINAKIKIHINSFLQDYLKHITYQKDLYEKQKEQLNQHMNHLFDSSITSSVQQKNKNCWIYQNSFYKFIVIEKTTVKFDSQVDKVNSFKKLKRPTLGEQKPIQSTCSKISPLSSPRQQSNVQNSQKLNIQLQTQQFKSIANNSKLSSKRIQKKQSLFKSFFGKNYEQFFQQNVKIQEGEKYVSNFPCGLADSIIISGRLYISNHRLFFHSRFNASNIFFGETKLQIPKVDIKKIQKRYNAIIFDNSISITTVNGQIFFTSFVSRDKAYELICQTFQITPDDNVFISEQQINQIQQNSPSLNLNLQQQDDLPKSEVQQRHRMVQQLIDSDEQQDQKSYKIQYKSIPDYQISYQGLNAAKFFKIFDSGQQMIYKNKTYPSFWHYFKGEVHKNQDLDITPWQPNILQYLNPNNIKSQTPLKFSRKIETKVPVPPNPIPFMPKFLQSVENSHLYFHSKNKYVIITKCVNSKAPYTDCFYIRFKKIVQKVGENNVSVKNSFKMIFTKSPLVRKMIQSKTLQQSLQNNNSQKEQIQKYLKCLQQNMLKKTQKQIKNKSNEKNREEQTQKILELNNELNQKIIQLEEQKIIVTKKLQPLIKKNSILTKVVIISVFINIILMFIILFGNNQVSINNKQISI